MHVDGFRFDLAATLARELHDVDRLSAFFDVIHQDPVHLAGEADRRAVGCGRRRLSGGQFPGPVGGVERQLSRHRARAIGRATTASFPILAYRLTGSSDLYQRDGRRPSASINFVTAHDGFTLHDLVSYNDKAQRSQRRRQPRRRQRQPLLELRRRRARPTIRRSSNCASARSAISWRRCSSRKACR